MLDANLKSQLEAYLKNIVHPVELATAKVEARKSYEQYFTVGAMYRMYLSLYKSIS